MKKVYALLATFIAIQFSFATIHEVQVANFQFTPASINVNVGDTVKWVWVNGSHTTTSVTIPAGAATWDNPMTSGDTTFLYKVTVAGLYNYKCIPHAAFGMLGTINASGILPVKFSAFNVVQKSNAASVLWSTASEQNADHFEIMRSTNGKTFTKVGSVTAAGNSSSLHNYSYTDNTLPAAERFLYYSLTIVDKDGLRTFSDIKMFTNLKGKTKLIVSLSPNPISRQSHLMLQFNAEKEGYMHAQLFNAAGKLIIEDNMYAVSGLNNGHFHIGDVAPGVYTITFSMDKQKESYQIIIQ